PQPGGLAIGGHPRPSFEDPRRAHHIEYGRGQQMDAGGFGVRAGRAAWSPRQNGPADAVPDALDGEPGRKSSRGDDRSDQASSSGRSLTSSAARGSTSGHSLNRGRGRSASRSAIDLGRADDPTERERSPSA